MTSNDIKKVQIIATTKDGKHLLSVSEDIPLILLIVASCKFVQLKDNLFAQYSIKELAEKGGEKC